MASFKNHTTSLSKYIMDDRKYHPEILELIAIYYSTTDFTLNFRDSSERDWKIALDYETKEWTNQDVLQVYIRLKNLVNLINNGRVFNEIN